MARASAQSITLTFYGPFTFTKGENYLFHSRFIRNAGVYVWTIKDERHGRNLVHYIGETASFGKRQREHLIGMTGLNYRIIDPALAKQGIEKIVWNGMWRDRSPDAAGTLLEHYDEVSRVVTEYIRLIKVYFAPIEYETRLRKHIEGCLGKHLREKNPKLITLYPPDNVVVVGEPLKRKVIVVLPDPIAGIDNELDI